MTRQSIHDRIMSREGGQSGRGDNPSGRAPARTRRWLRGLGLAAIAMLLMAIGIGAGAYHRQMLAMLGLATAPDAVAADTETTDDAGDADPPAEETARESTPFTQHAEEAGVTTCANTFAAMGDMLTAGSRYGVQSFWNEESPDAHAVRALVGMSYQTEAYSGPAAGYVFAAPDESGCEGSMVRVAPYSAPCEEVTSILPEGSERINALRDVTVYSLGSGGQALLLPTGPSCVVISVASGA